MKICGFVILGCLGAVGIEAAEHGLRFDVSRTIFGGVAEIL